MPVPLSALTGISDVTHPQDMAMRRYALARYLRPPFWVTPLCLLLAYGCAGTARQGAPSEPPAERYARALQYLSMGAGEAAVRELTEAVKAEPTNAEYHTALAAAYHY